METTSQRLERLREEVHGEPSLEGLERLGRLLEAWPGGPERAVGVRYLCDHLVAGRWLEVMAQSEQATVRMSVARLAVALKDDAHEAHGAVAMAGLKVLYEGGGHWNALVEVLKNELAALPPQDEEARVARLAQMLVIYRDHINVQVLANMVRNQLKALRPEHPEV